MNLRPQVRAVVVLAAIIAASCEEDVTAPNGPSRGAATLLVTPADATLLVDDTLRLTATVLDEVGNPVPDAVVRWSLEPGSALNALDTEGLTASFAAVFLGNGEITAETEGLTFTINVRVNRSEVASILIMPDSLTLVVGDTSRLTFVVRDTTGAVIPTPHLEWACGFNDAAACIPKGITIDTTGLVTAISPDFTLLPYYEVAARSREVWSNTIRITVL